MTFKCLFSKEFFISLGIVFLLLASTGLWISSLVNLKKGVDNEIQFVLDTCDKYRECEKNLPNYVTLYLSTVSIHTNPLYKKIVSLKLITPSSVAESGLRNGMAGIRGPYSFFLSYFFTFFL